MFFLSAHVYVKAKTGDTTVSIQLLYTYCRIASFRLHVDVRAFPHSVTIFAMKFAILSSILSAFLGHLPELLRTAKRHVNAINRLQ